MGFYVSGVDAPKNCRECGHDLATIANCVYTKRLVLPEEHDMSSGRHPLCPICPVETPHGRMIDARYIRDAIIQKWMDKAGDSHMYKCGMEDAYEVIRNAPTIVPAEEGER